MNAGEVVALSRKLYGFTGEAWLCSIPGDDFGVGEGLSAKAQGNVARAVELLRIWSSQPQYSRATPDDTPESISCVLL